MAQSSLAKTKQTNALFELGIREGEVRALLMDNRGYNTAVRLRVVTVALARAVSRRS